MADSQGSPDRILKNEIDKVRKLSDGIEQKLDNVELKYDQLRQTEFSSNIDAYDAWQQTQDLLLDLEFSDSFKDLPDAHQLKTRLTCIKVNIENSLSSTRPTVKERVAGFLRRRSSSCASINLDAPSDLSSRSTRQSVALGVHSPPSGVGLPAPRRKRKAKMSVEDLSHKTPLQELQEEVIGEVNKSSEEYKKQAKAFKDMARSTISLINSTTIALHGCREAVEELVAGGGFGTIKAQFRAVQDCKEDVEACKEAIHN